MFHYFLIDTSRNTLSGKNKEQMNDITKKYVNLQYFTFNMGKSYTLWTFKLLMRAGETRNSLNACL